MRSLRQSSSLRIFIVMNVADLSLLGRNMFDAALSFEADFIDQLRIQHNMHFEINSPGFGVGFRVVHQGLNFEGPKIWATEALRHLRGASKGSALRVHPQVVAKAGGLYDEFIALPCSGRITAPGRLRIYGKRPAIR